MNNNKLIFKATKISNNNPSRIYAFKMFAITARTALFYLIDALFFKNCIKKADKHLKKFANDLFLCSHTTLIVKNQKEIINSSCSYIFMSNHSSVMDIPSLFLAIPGSLRMVAKDQLLKFPVFGYALVKSGFIMIDRTKTKKAIKQLEIAKKIIKKGISIWISPEGTRNCFGCGMKSFKKGGFHIAIDLGIPIIPIWIEGSADVIKSNSIVVYPNKTISVTFGKPIKTSGILKKNISILIEKVRLSILSLKN